MDFSKVANKEQQDKIMEKSLQDKEVKAMRDTQMKPPKKYTKSFAEWFTDVMIEQDIDISKVCERYSNICPTYRTVLRWIYNHPEFEDMITYARETQVMLWKQQIDDLVEEAKFANFNNKHEVTEYYSYLKTKIDVLKFKLSKLAPLISSKYEKSNQKSAAKNQKGTNDYQIKVANYSAK